MRVLVELFDSIDQEVDSTPEEDMLAEEALEAGRNGRGTIVEFIGDIPVTRLENITNDRNS